MVDERRRNELAVGGLDCSGDRAGVRHIPRPGATARLFRLVSRLSSPHPTQCPRPNHGDMSDILL